MLKHRIVIINRSGLNLSATYRRQLRYLAARLLQSQGVMYAVEFSIVLVKNSTIAKLNKCYRGKEGATDVLSFPIDLSTDVHAVAIRESPYKALGDIVIAPEVAIRQAIEAGHRPKREIAFLTLHGLLHLLGRDHGYAEDDVDLADMMAITNNIMESVYGRKE